MQLASLSNSHLLAVHPSLLMKKAHFQRRDGCFASEYDSNWQGLRGIHPICISVGGGRRECDTHTHQLSLLLQ